MIKRLLFLCALAMPCAMQATDFYVSPEGNGAKDGSNWENAMGLTEFTEHMKFTFNSTPVNDSHTGEQFFFATGTYTFNSTLFVYRSGVNFTGGYDLVTGQPSKTARTIFDGNNKERNAGAMVIMADSKRDEAGQARTVIVKNIDFQNFISKGEWRGNETNWQSARPGAIYICNTGYAEILGCNFSNNKCAGSGDNAMAGAISINKANVLVRECSFLNNSGTDGGAIKLYYNVSGEWVKNVYLVVDRCSFSGNTSTTNGGAIYGRNSMAIDILNSTFTGNTAANGGAVYSNAPGNYDQIVNIVSSTIAGNTAESGSQVGTGANGVVHCANSIIVAAEGIAPMEDASSTEGYSFLGNNLVGEIAEGYTSTVTDNIDKANNYAYAFGTNTLADNGTLAPVKYFQGMAPESIASIVAEQSWNYSVDTAIDQIGAARTIDSCNGAYALDETTTGTITIDTYTEDETWYNLQGMPLYSQPTQKGLYIHKGKKVLVL